MRDLNINLMINENEDVYSSILPDLRRFYREESMDPFLLKDIPSKEITPFHEEVPSFSTWGLVGSRENIKNRLNRLKSLPTALCLLSAVALIPLVFSLMLGIVYRHAGLILGSGLLIIEGLYVITAVTKSKRKR